MPERISFSAGSLSPAEAALATRLQPVLDAVSALQGRERLLMAIDGPCGSGKTTLAALLCRLLDCPCVHMDDFHMPHARKTPERMAQPGGNSDRERLLDEVLLPWREGRSVAYRPYDCAADGPGAPISLPACPVLVLEGSYAHHPDLSGVTDVRVFIRVDREEQLRRIAARSPEKLQQFIDRWIPLEDSYFRAFQLPVPGSVTVDNAPVQGM
ncbi:MAG: uridine kinase [Aristaeellaceae bacterium]